MARKSFREEITKEHPRYKKIKSAILGMFYGLTPYGYSKNEDVPLEEAEAIFKAIYAAFPKTKAYIDIMQSRNPGIVKSVLGRTMYVHPYDRNWKNDVLNFPMQSSGSDMIKIAMRNLRRHPFYVENHPKGKLDIILQVHDEIVTEVDVDIAEEWNIIMPKIMIDVAEKLHPGIVGNVSGGLIHSWAEKE
jgi:DNA polymerase-1